MECQICGKAIHNEKPLNILDKTYYLCVWCLGRINAYIHGNVHHDAINILWGAGRIGREWYQIRDFIRENKVEDVLEFGTGLSTELFVIEGIPIVSCDILLQHLELYKKLNTVKEKATFYHYENKNLPDFNSLFPNKKWDMVFVDGPHERSNEVRAAMKLAKRFIYLHDPNLGEQSFFPNEDWELIRGVKLFKRKQND
jgi:hypothetical protein